MDFEAAPPRADSYVSDLRDRLGIGPDEYFLLQPTRVVPRKRIERAIELAKRLDMPCTLVISHDSGDEGSEYLKFLNEYIDLMDVKTIFAVPFTSPRTQAERDRRQEAIERFRWRRPRTLTP